MKSKTHLPKYEIGVHFLTAKTFQNTPFFNDPTCALIFCEELEAARVRYAFHVLAFVVMPNHIHLLLWWDTEAQPDLTISRVAWAVKGMAARRIVQYLKSNEVGEQFRNRAGDGMAVAYPELANPQHTPAHRLPLLLKPVLESKNQPHYRNWRYKIWQQGAGYDFNIYTPHKLQEKVTYIHANPVRAGLVSSPEEYPWSSAAHYAGIGEAWAGQSGVGKGHPVKITFYPEIL